MTASDAEKLGGVELLGFSVSAEVNDANTQVVLEGNLSSLLAEMKVALETPGGNYTLTRLGVGGLNSDMLAPSVSKDHAVFSNVEGILTVKDISSKGTDISFDGGGTFVPIGNGSSRQIEHGTSLRVPLHKQKGRYLYLNFE